MIEANQLGEILNKNCSIDMLRQVLKKDFLA